MVLILVSSIFYRS